MVPTGSLNAACKVNWESLPIGMKRSTRAWPRMVLATPAPLTEKGRAVGKTGAQTSNWRPAANLRSLLKELAVRLRQQKPITVCKDGRVKKLRRYFPSGLEVPDHRSGEGDTKQRLPER